MIDPGILVYRYEIAPEAWLNASEYPPNAAYFHDGPSGVMNLTEALIAPYYYSQVDIYLYCVRACVYVYACSCVCGSAGWRRHTHSNTIQTSPLLYLLTPLCHVCPLVSAGQLPRCRPSLPRVRHRRGRRVRGGQLQPHVHLCGALNGGCHRRTEAVPREHEGLFVVWSAGRGPVE